MLCEQEDGALELNNVPKLKAAYHAALVDVQGRPEWRKTLGMAEMKTIIARTIIEKSVGSESSIPSLSALAIGAIKEKFLVRMNSAALV